MFRFRTTCKIIKNLEKNEQERSSKHQAEPQHLRTLQASVRCPAISIFWEFLLLVDCHHHCCQSLRWQIPLFCASPQPSFQLLLGCTIFHYTPKKEAGISVCWCTLEEGAGPSACRGERPSFREPCPRLECPQGGAGQAIAGYVKHGVDGGGWSPRAQCDLWHFQEPPKLCKGAAPHWHCCTQASNQRGSPSWSLYTFAHHHLAQNMIHSMWLLRISQIIKRRQNVLNITEDLDMCWELLSDFDKIPRCLKANVKPAMPFWKLSRVLFVGPMML